MAILSTVMIAELGRDTVGVREEITNPEIRAPSELEVMLTG